MFEGCATETPTSRPQSVNGVPTPATPRVWAVSHRDIHIYAVEACGDVTCFCSSFFTPHHRDINNSGSANVGVMTPKTVQRIRRNIGVAYKYVERDVALMVPFLVRLLSKMFHILTISHRNRHKKDRNLMDIIITF